MYFRYGGKKKFDASISKYAVQNGVFFPSFICFSKSEYFNIVFKVNLTTKYNGEVVKYVNKTI
jgi:hypothetical protein